MIAAILIATTLGALATYSLVGRSTVRSASAHGFLLGLGTLAVSGAGFGAITLPWAIGMVVAVTLGLVLAPVMPARRGPFAAAVSMTAGLVMAAGIVRWLVPIGADLGNLDARVLALVVIATGAVWAVGRTGSWLRTAFGLCVATGVLLLVAGVVAGAPGTVVSPLVSPTMNPALGVGWLVLVVLFAVQHPAPGRSAAGVAALAGVQLAGLLGLLSLLAGSLVFPATGLLTVAGYATFGAGAPGAVLAVGTALVAAVGLGVTMRVVLEPWQGTPAPAAWLARPGLRIAAVATLVGLLSFAPVPTAALVAAPALFGVVALIVDRRTPTPAGVQVMSAR